MREFTVDMSTDSDVDIQNICKELNLEYRTLYKRIEETSMNNEIKNYHFVDDNGLLCCWLKFIGVDTWYIREDTKVFKRVGERDIEMQPVMYECDNCFWINITYKGKVTRNTLHKLYAKAFIQNPNNYKFVEFIDGNRTNISKENLKWVKNCKSRDISINYASERRAKKIVMLTLDDEFIKVYNSVKEGAEDNNVKPANISACLRGYTRQSCGYHWRYYKDYVKEFGEIQEK